MSKQRQRIFSYYLLLVQTLQYIKEWYIVSWNLKIIYINKHSYDMCAVTVLQKHSLSRCSTGSCKKYTERITKSTNILSVQGGGEMTQTEKGSPSRSLFWPPSPGPLSKKTARGGGCLCSGDKGLCQRALSGRSQARAGQTVSGQRILRFLWPQHQAEAEQEEVVWVQGCGPREAEPEEEKLQTSEGARLRTRPWEWGWGWGWPHRGPQSLCLEGQSSPHPHR